MAVLAGETPPGTTLRARVGRTLLLRKVRLFSPAIASAPGVVSPFLPLPVRVGCAVLSLGGLGAASASAYATDREADKLYRRADARSSLQFALNLLCRAKQLEGTHLRANVMIWDVDEKGLRIAHCSGGYGDREMSVVWRPEEGACGRAWETQLTAIYPDDGETPANPADAGKTTRPWGMTSEQIHETSARVKMAVSTPLTEPDDRSTLIGVLSFDCDRAVDRPVADDLAKVAEQSREMVAGLLWKAGLNFPSRGADLHG